MASQLAEKNPKPEPVTRNATPEVGAKISIRLPLETTRATVLEVHDPRNLVAKLDVMEPMAKTHGYFFNDKVNVALRRGLGGLPYWEATEKV